MVTFPAHRAVEFPDPGGVVVRGVDRGCPVREDRVEDLKAAFDLRPARFVIGQIDPVQQMSTVPRICKDWSGKAHVREERCHLPGGGKGGVMLRFC